VSQETSYLQIVKVTVTVYYHDSDGHGHDCRVGDPVTELLTATGTVAVESKSK
jgi:hypothetical protein